MPGPAISSPWKKTPDRKSERNLKQEAVLTAAARVFAERGYHRASLDEVAQILNVTKPTLYYYFKNKEAMLFACIQQALDTLETASDESQDAPAMTGRDRLVAYLKRYATTIETDFGRCAVRISDAELSESSRKKVRRVKIEIDRKLRELVANGITDGSIVSSDPKITAFAIAGALNSIGHWHQRDAELAGRKMIEEYIALLVNGLAPRRK